MGGGPTKTNVDPPTRSDKELWTVILGRRNRKPQKRDPLTSQVATYGSTASPDLRSEHTAGKTKADTDNHTREKPGPTPLLENRTRPTYNQVSLEIQEENSATQDTERLNTEERTSSTYLRKATPKGASYTEILGKARAPLGVLRGERRAKIAAERENQQPHWMTPTEVTGNTEDAPE